MDIIEFLDISSIIPAPYGDYELRKAIIEYYDDILGLDALNLEVEISQYKEFKG